MEKYSVVIVDDDDVSLENLSFELGKDDRFSVDGIAHNGKQGRKIITKIQPELLFLDVEMPDMTGMELLQEIRDSISWNMRVVFYTAYDKYMIQAIRESAFDYLAKKCSGSGGACAIGTDLHCAHAGQRFEGFAFVRGRFFPLLFGTKAVGGNPLQPAACNFAPRHYGRADHDVFAFVCADTSVIHHQYGLSDDY